MARGGGMADSRIARREFLAVLGSAAVALGPSATAAEGPVLAVGPVRRVGPAGVKFIEPWIAANPRDSSNLVIVGSHNLGDSATPATLSAEPAAWFTADGGATWSPGEIAGAAELRRGRPYFADAYATYAPDGTAFYSLVGHPEGKRLDLWVYRSDDGGRRWQGPTTLDGGGFDYPRLVADLDRGKPRVFVAVATEGDGPVFGKAKRSGYGCAVLRSDDGARSFSVVNFLAPTTLQHDPIDSPIVLPDGRLLVGIIDYPPVLPVAGITPRIARTRTYTATSRDGGATFTTLVPVRDSLHRDGFVGIAADLSGGPRRGRLYAVGYSRTANPPGLELQTSDDGAVWTPPTAVPGLRAGPIPLAAVAVSPRGVLGLAWIQGEPGDPVRPDDAAWTSREHTWDLYFTASTDGGATFAAPVSVLKTSSRTDPKLPRWPHGTDYIALAASPDGSFHPVWIDTRDSKGEIQTARIEVRP